ncbi:MAG: histidine phosphatase family protein [Burkholderiales bacterium]|nr:histidine phosphatase family protein [Burkholderiales bacterium]
MGRLFLVRHGQASFGAANYDQLSPLGRQQCRRLGEYFREKGLLFEAALMGTLQRHAQSHEAIAEGLQSQHQPLLWPGLNEYDSHAVIAAVHPEPLAKPTTPEMYRHHFRLLREGLRQWMAGKVQPVGMPSYVDFVAGVAGALDHVRENFKGDVLMVSSGGPISTAVGLLLETPPEVTIELNLHIRNSSVTEFTYTPKRHALVTYNTLPHLDSAQHADWVTHT